MQALIIKFIYIALAIYGAMALFISLRDIITTKNKTLWVSVLGVVLSALTLVFFPSSFPLLSLPFALIISVPIFITDGRRNWDILDRVFRWVSIFAVLVCAFVFINYYFLR